MNQSDTAGDKENTPVSSVANICLISEKSFHAVIWPSPEQTVPRRCHSGKASLRSESGSESSGWLVGWTELHTRYSGMACHLQTQRSLLHVCCSLLNCMQNRKVNLNFFLSLTWAGRFGSLKAAREGIGRVVAFTLNLVMIEMGGFWVRRVRFQENS